MIDQYPALHLVHDEALFPEYLPAEQDGQEQLLLESTYVPALQELQPLEPFPEYLPTPQLEQLLDPLPE